MSIEADVSEATNMPPLAWAASGESQNASTTMNSDMMKPIPAKQAAPNISAHPMATVILQALVRRASHAASMIPAGSPTTKPAIIPIGTG
jgi:hypothetical protein